MTRLPLTHILADGPPEARITLCGAVQTPENPLYHGGMVTATCLNCMAVYQAAAEIGLHVLSSEGVARHVLEGIRVVERVRRKTPI